MIRRVVVAADGSPAGTAAVHWAADLAHTVGARVLVVHAAGLIERASSASANEEAFEGDLRTRVEREWCAALRDRGVLYEVVVQPGPPVSTILDVAAGADLVVVGRRGTGSPDAPQLGSTSLQLVAESDVPVVVVARPAG